MHASFLCLIAFSTDATHLCVRLNFTFCRSCTRRSGTACPPKGSDQKEINKICDPYWVAAYPDVVSSSDEDEEAAPPGGAAPAGRPRQDSDLDDDPDDDLPIGRLRAGSGATFGDGSGAVA